MAKYKRCPNCNHKNSLNDGICSNCHRLLDVQPIPKESKKTRQDNKTNNIFTIIRFLVLFFSLVLLISYCLNNPSKQKLAASKKPYKEESFINKIDAIVYNSDYIDNKLIPVKDYSNSTPFKLISTNGQVVIDNITAYIADYNSFHIITKKSNNDLFYYIVNNNGEIIYKSQNRIYYYPETNSWIIGDKLYHGKKMIKDNIRIEDKKPISGHYFTYVDEEEQGIISYDGNYGYKSNKKEYNHFVLETTNILFPGDNNYCLINDNYKYLITNCTTGEVLTSNNSKRIYEIAPNTFYQDNTIFHINKKGESVSFNTKKSLEKIYVEYLDNDKILINDEVYDELIDSKTSVNEANLKSLSYKNIESLLETQKEYCLDITEIKYGLKYQNTSIIPCENDSIIYYSDNITQRLLSQQKKYLLITNHKKTGLYDINNNRYLIDDVTNYSPYSIFLKYKGENHNYIYNILSNEKIEIPEDTFLELHSNYFMVEKYSKETTTTNREYYNYDFKNIYLGK